MLSEWEYCLFEWLLVVSVGHRVLRKSCRLASGFGWLWPYFGSEMLSRWKGSDNTTTAENIGRKCLGFITATRAPHYSL